MNKVAIELAVGAGVIISSVFIPGYFYQSHNGVDAILAFLLPFFYFTFKRQNLKISSLLIFLSTLIVHLLLGPLKKFFVSPALSNLLMNNWTALTHLSALQLITLIRSHWNKDPGLTKQTYLIFVVPVWILSFLGLLTWYLCCTNYH